MERKNRFYKQLEAICYLSTAAFVHAEMTMKTRSSCISMNSPTFLCVEGATLHSSNKQPSVFTWEDTTNLPDNLRSKRSHCTCWHPGHRAEKPQSHAGGGWPQKHSTKLSLFYPPVRALFRETESKILTKKHHYFSWLQPTHHTHS